MNRGTGRPLSVCDIFSLGIGPSSSHTVGPMRAARHFANELAEVCRIAPVPARIVTDLMGSLGATGHGHSTDRAVVLGLSGYHPESVPTSVVSEIIDDVAADGVLTIPGVGGVPFVLERDMRFIPRVILPYHVNGLTIRALASDGEPLLERTYYSVGGGFVMQEIGDPVNAPNVVSLNEEAQQDRPPAPFPYSTGDQLIALCTKHGLRISDIVMANEMSLRPREDVIAYLNRVWQAMQECIEAGCQEEGYLPGMLWVERRAKHLLQELQQRGSATDPMAGMDWVNLYALAVNEENAAGHRVVTAPTNGAAGVVPAVLTYFVEFVEPSLGASAHSEPHGRALTQPEHDVVMYGGTPVGETDGEMDDVVPGEIAIGHLSLVHRFLLTAAAIGGLIKTNASIAGAEVGCQGEVGSASAMAAGGLAEALGGDPLQVENAAEIAMEHSLGLTCDPVGGLVQIPCIERNAIAAVKAINAARMALWGDGRHIVSFDTVIETMRQTGADMHTKYKETSEGGLAVHVVEC